MANKNNTVKTLTKSPILRIAMVIMLSIAWIIALPFVIISLPFILAWDTTTLILDALNKKETHKSSSSFLDKNKWVDFTSDFNSWLNYGDDDVR